jgi:hypothetical protein
MSACRPTLVIDGTERCLREGWPVSPDVNSAEVVIKRRRGWTGSLLPWTVRLDGKEAGKLYVIGSLTITTSPGLHSITVTQVKISSEPLHFDVQAGGRIELVTQAATISGKVRVWHQGLPPGESPTLPVPIKPAAGRRRAGAGRSLAPVNSVVIEGRRYEVPLGDDTRRIDYSQSSSSTTRTMSISRVWTKSYSLDITRHNVIRGSAGLALPVLALEAEAERALRNRYSISVGEREVFEEQVTLNVTGPTRSEITFSWKQIRQQGTVRLSGADFDVDIPFEAVVGVTFDHRQVDDA